MSLFTRIAFSFLFLIIVSLITTIYSPNNNHSIDNAEESAVDHQVSRHRRAVKHSTRYCKLNQYYDQEEGRCLGVPGGGKALYVDNERSCGVNMLKPHCTSSLYYFICKRDKSVLAQCANGQLFDNRLQRCVRHDPSKSSPSTIRPDEYYENRDHVQTPSCTKSGRFPVPDRCSVFYVCDTNGHRLVQSVFKCPQNTGYHAEREICTAMPECENDNSVGSAICVPDAPDEAVEFPRSAEQVTTENVERTTEETPEESETANVNDSDTLQSDSATEAITDESPSSPTDGYQMTHSLEKNSETDETPILDRAASVTENAQIVSEEARKNEEKAESVSSDSSPTELADDAPHSVTTSMTSAEPEYATDAEANANVDSGTTDAAPFSSINSTSSELHETTRDVSKELYRNIEAVDPTTSGLPDTPSTDLTELDDETAGRTTELDKNDEGAETLANSNAEEAIDPNPAVSDILESSSNDTSSLTDAREQDPTTVQYRSNIDVTSPPNTEIVDPSTTMSDVESVSGPNDDKIPLEPTSDATLSSDVASDADQYTTTRGLTETSSIDDA